MSKIAIFYMIGQYNENWVTNFYYDQIGKLQNSGLHDECQFIDLFVKGSQHLPQLTHKFNHITYLNDLEEDSNINRRLYRAYNYIQHRIWSFSLANPDYKILFFHSLGVSHANPAIQKNKFLWRNNYLEKLLIDNWQDCVNLLQYYDCVGTDYVALGRYTNATNNVILPHYQGFFWWANSNYISTLDPKWVHKDLEWQSWLCEAWIGSGGPKAYNFFASGINHYDSEIYPPIQDIINLSRSHIETLKLNKEKNEL